MNERIRSLAVIGAGPGGYVAAIRAAQLGMKVTLIEKSRVGGTCLNHGCIPAKALLHAARSVKEARAAAANGILLTVQGIDWEKVQQYRENTIAQLTGGVEKLLRSNGVEIVNAEASFIRPRTLELCMPDGTKAVIEADRVIIATGSEPVMPPIEGLRESRYVCDASGMLRVKKIPDSLLIIGGGVIGIEFACAFRAFGTKVTIVEALDEIAPTLDGEIAERLHEILTGDGIEILTGSRVVKIEDGEAEAKVYLQRDNEQKVSGAIAVQTVLCAVGRRPHPQSLQTQRAGILTENGRIVTDDYLMTSVSGVYAIGDCTGKAMLAHTASAMGEIAAENAAGKPAEHRKYQPVCVPSGIYSMPETAGAGYTEEQLKAEGRAYHIGRFPLVGNGRAIIEGEKAGLVKVLIGDRLGELLGVHIIAPQALEMIENAVTAISLEVTADEIIDTVYPHPTVSEAIREAVLAAQGRPIHMPARRAKG